MRTLLISEVFPPRVGGTARWFYEVYRRYPAGEVSVLTDYQDGDEEADRDFPQPVVRTPIRMDDWGFLCVRSLLQYFRHLGFARRLARNHHIQRVHCARVMPEGVIAYLLWRIWRLPYCVYAHGEEIGTAASSRQLKLLMRLVYGAARCIVANSRNTKALLRQAGVPGTRITVISPGVDTDRFTPKEMTLARRHLGLGDHTILLSVGRLQRRKGHDMVVKALPILAARIPDIRYVIVGRGEEESRLRELTDQARLGHLVHFAGSVADDQLPDYYNSCDLFLMPNREEANNDIEGFGIVFLEAGACGKPVVGGKSGGTGDAVVEGKTGLLVNGRCHREIAEAALSLLCDRKRAAELGRNGRARTIELFGWEKVTERIRKLDQLRDV